MSEQTPDVDSVHDHALEPPGLGDPDEPYLLPDCDPADEERELPFCADDDA
jgi:hypothetical protein